jgi:hypothetical protein
VVTWVGRRTIDCRHHPNPRAVWPVRVQAGTFAEGCPARDLWLSPDHAIHVEDVLIPVKHLIDGGAISQVAVERITYWHIELPTHDVILANDLPTESYLDTGNRSAFANGGASVALFPDFAPLLWAGRGAFPLVVTGPVLQKVRRRLRRRRATAA